MKCGMFGCRRQALAGKAAVIEERRAASKSALGLEQEMRLNIKVVGGGPSGLYFAYLMKKSYP